jgi:hypothetical protein
VGLRRCLDGFIEALETIELEDFGFALGFCYGVFVSED